MAHRASRQLPRSKVNDAIAMAGAEEAEYTAVEWVEA